MEVKIVEMTDEQYYSALYQASLQTIRTNEAHQWEEYKEVYTADTTQADLDIKMPVHDDQIFVVTHLSVVDITSKATTIGLYNVKSGRPHLLIRDAPSAAAVSVNWDGMLITGPEQLLRASIFGAGASDNIRFYASGYWIKS